MSTIRITWRDSAGEPRPVRIPLPPRAENRESWQLVDAAGGGYPVQQAADGHGVAILAPTGGTSEYRLEPGVAAAAAVRTHLRGLDALEISVDGELFTVYHCARDLARPFLHPVLLPGGVGVTRNFPMQDVEGEMHDHPHHRSIWSAYGEVGGVDNWSEARGKHGRIQHEAFNHIFEGPVFGGFEASSLWTDVAGAPVLRETRRVIVYHADPERRLFDYDLSLTAADREVDYGDTKEGGLLSVRVATSMDGNKGGRIQNSEGGVGEKECWGKQARWCDYSGPVQGKTVGIAVLDHPLNFRSPVRWHARDYGLMTTNCFGTSTFEGEAGGHRGEYRQRSDETLRFRYRVFMHRGDASSARVEAVWQAFAHEPEVVAG